MTKSTSSKTSPAECARPTSYSTDLSRFFQTYLAIITEVEASGQAERIPEPRRPFRHDAAAGGHQHDHLPANCGIPRPRRLTDDVGILFIEIVQPSRLSIDRQATVRVCVYRRAERRDQHDTVTNRIREIMR